MKKLFAFAIIAIAALTSGCSFTDEGKAGVIVNWNNTIDRTEVSAGDMTQTITQDLLQFPIRQVTTDVNDLTPLAKGDATMAKVDFTTIYNISQSCVADLYAEKSADFHGENKEGEPLLMSNYVGRLVRNAVYKEVRAYDAMGMNDKRADIESAVRTTLTNMITADKLDGCITIQSVQARTLAPPRSLKDAADKLIRATIERETKEQEVLVAQQEAQRIAALNANKGAIEYMDAQSRADIAAALREGKAGFVVVPYDFKGIVNTK